MKKIAYIILLVLLAVLLAVFVSQNSAHITIHFLAWDFDFYGGLIIMFSFLFGALVMSLIWAFTLLHQHQKEAGSETDPPEETSSREKEND